LKSENTNLVAAYRDKQRKHQQTQELYDRLKRKEMTAATQSAAFESVDEALGHVQSRPGYDAPMYSQQYSGARAKQPQRDFQPAHVDHNGIEQVHTHQRSGSNNSQGSGGLMPPPPPIRRSGATGSMFGHSEYRLPWLLDETSYCYLANAMPTPSNHRTQLGPVSQSGNRVGAGNIRNPSITANRSSQSHTPAQRQPFANVSGNTLDRPSVGGYGMSAGMKIGRQQGKKAPIDFDLLSKSNF